MDDFTDLEVRVERDGVSLRLREREFRGAHGLGARAELDALRDAGPDKYGVALFKALFADEETEAGYREAVGESNERATRWRMRLNVEDSALHDLWWEALRDEHAPYRKFATDRFTPLSRYLPRPLRTNPAPADTLRVLAVVSNPTDLGSARWPGLAPLEPELERETLDQAFENLRVECEVLDGRASESALRARLRSPNGPHVLHLVAHGWRSPDGTGVLLLEGEDGTAAPVDERRLGDLVSGLGDSPLRLVVLASCQSAVRSQADPFMGLAPRLVEFGMPAVVAMQDRVAMGSARRFSKIFYDSLADPGRANGMVDVAMNDARDELNFTFGDNTWDWAIPVLFLRGEGRVFDLGGERNGGAPALGSVLSPVVGAGVEAGAGPARAAVDPGLRMRLFADLVGRSLEPHRTVAYLVLGEELSPELEAAEAEVRARELMRRCEAAGQLVALDALLRSWAGMRESAVRR